MTDDVADIFISGAGIAGLSAAAAFAQGGFSVVVCDPSEDTADAASDPTADLRSTAFLQPARTLFEGAGIWDILAPHATALRHLQVADSAGDPPEILEKRIFTSDDLGDAPFGWNLPNWRIRSLLIRHLARRPGVTLRLGRQFASMVTRDREAIVTLDDGSRMRARLVVGADGRNSPVRTAAGLHMETTRYGQRALAFAASHAIPHDNVSTEIYLHGGAFTTVPLHDHSGAPASAIVWMMDGPDAVRLANLDQASFDRELNARSCGILGPMQRVTGVRVWPVVTCRAPRLTSQRVALVAEAAHVLPPIGAQGLNTSLGDVATLFDLATANPDALGSRAHLDAFEKVRARDLGARTRVIDLYNRICRSGEQPIQALRRTGLKIVHDVAPLRRTVMRAGLGPTRDVN